jgi:hypothetical protein
MKRSLAHLVDAGLSRMDAIVAGTATAVRGGADALADAKVVVDVSFAHD